MTAIGQRAWRYVICSSQPEPAGFVMTSSPISSPSESYRMLKNGKYMFGEYLKDL
jgi:hypothetical protein